MTFIVVEVAARPFEPRNLQETEHVPAVSAFTVARVKIPPVRSQVATPVTEQIAGVREVTSSKWPIDARPELFPLANKVDARNCPLLLARSVTALARTIRPVLDVDEVKYGVITIAASPATGAGSGAGVATGTGLMSIVPKTLVTLFCHSSIPST